MDMDLRLKQLSYSSVLTLHSCPRKFQLQKLRGRIETKDTMSEETITFAYGHAVGTGIQHLLEGKSMQDIVIHMFLNWYADLLAENEKQNKSFYTAVAAIQKFNSMRLTGFLEDYELVVYKDKPACELGFCITTPDGFRFRGFVDAILKHKYTGEIVVLEVKTTSSTSLNAAQYKNSSQALGYSVVLDVIFPELSSYKVFYLPYKTKDMEWEILPFAKSFTQRAQWIQELILDIETIKMYEGVGIYPSHGESCYDYYKECEFFGICTLRTESLINQFNEEDKERIEKEVFEVNLSLADLITAQLGK